jgi:hypothetical protein
MPGWRSEVLQTAIFVQLIQWIRFEIQWCTFGVNAR